MKHQIAPIRTSEELFRALSENGIDADCLLDSRLRIIYATPSTEHVLGYSVDSVLGKNMLHTIIHPDDRRNMLESLLRVKHNPEQTTSMRFRLYHRDGSWRWMRGSARNLLDHPAVNAIACNCYDISEIVEAERERSRVLEVTRCILWEADVQDRGDPILCWNTRIVNPSAARDFLVLEQTAEQSYGDAWYRSRDVNDRERMNAAAAEAMRSGKSSYTQEFRCQTRDGSIRWMLEDARIEPIEPCRWHVVGVVLDITDRKQSEIAREKSEERQRFLAIVSGILNESLDYQISLQRISTAMVPGFADWCRIDLLNDDGVLELVAVENADESMLELDRRLTRDYPPKPDSPHPALVVMQTGRPQLTPIVIDELLEAVAHDETHLSLLRQRRFQSIICVPIQARGQLKGTMMLFTQHGGRVYDEADLDLAEEIGRRAGVALDNARLYGELELSLAERGKLTEEREWVVHAASCILWKADVYNRSVNGLPLSKDGLCWDLRISLGYAAQQYIAPWDLDLTDAEGNWHQCKHPDDRERMDDTSAAAIYSNQPGYSHEFRCKTLSGEWRWLHEDVNITGEETGHWRLVGVVTDITDRKRADERMRFLVRLSGILHESLEFQTVLQQIAAALVPDFADWSRIDLVDEEGRMDLVALGHADPELLKAGRALSESHPPKPGSLHPVLTVMTTGRPYFTARVDDEVLRSIAYNDEHLQALRREGMLSTIIVPLQARGHLIGTLGMMTSTSGRLFDEADVELAEEIGRRATIAIDNARLYSDLERSVQERQKLARERERVVQSAHCILWEADVHKTPIEGLPVSPRGFCWDFRIARGQTASQFISPEKLDSTDYEGRWYDCKHIEDRNRMEDTCAEALCSDESGYTQKFRCRNLSGEWRWLHEDVTITLVDSGHWRLVGVVTDITERERASERLDFLARVSGILNESLEYETALQRIANAMVADFADWCRIDMLTPNGDTELVAIAAIDPDKHEWGADITGTYPPKPGSRHPVLVVIEIGRSYFAPSVSPEVLDSVAYNEEHARILQQMGIVSTICVPLQARGELFGTMMLVTTGDSGRAFDESDLELAEEIGRRAAVAIDNARLFSQLDRAVKERRRLEEERERLIRTASCMLWEADIYSSPKERLRESSNALVWDLRIARGSEAERFIPPESLDATDFKWTWHDCKHPDDRDKMDTRADDAIRSGLTGYTQEFRCRTLTGDWRWLYEEVTIRPTGDDRWRLVGVITDITDRKRAAERLTFLARVSGILNESLDFESSLQLVASAMAPDLADWCRIDLLNDEGDLELVALGHEDPQTLDRVRNLTTVYPLKSGSMHPAFTVLQTGRSLLQSSVSDELLRSIAHDEEHLKLLHERKHQSIICVPLTAGSHLRGTLMLINSSARRAFDEADLGLAEEIGRRAAIAIDNARLYSQLERAVTERTRMEAERDRVVSSANCILWKADIWSVESGYSWSFRLMNKEMAARFISADLDEEEHGRVWDGIKHPQDIPAMALRAEKALVSGALGYTQEFRARSLDGSWRWLREDVRINLAGPEHWNVVGVCTDVTDARALQEQRDRVMLAANCLLWEAEVASRGDSDIDEPIRTAGDYLWNIRILNSESARRFLQMENIGTTDYAGAWFQSKHPTDRELMDARSSDAITQGLDGYSQDYRCRTHEGEWRWLHEDARIERVDQGKWRVVGVCTDITEIKNAEGILSQTNQQLTVLNSIISEVSSTLHLERILKNLAEGLSDDQVQVSALLIGEYAGAPSVQRASWNLPDSDIETIYGRIRNGLNLLEQQNAFPDFLEACAVLTQTLNIADSDWHSYLALPLLVHGHFNGVVVLISNDPHAFDRSPVSFYESLSHAVAIAVQNARLFEQIRDANERLHEISRQMVEVQEEERRQIARDLHDEIGQLLTGIKIQLQLIESAVPGKASAEIARVNETVTQLMVQVRDMSLKLRPPILDDFGLGPALCWLTERYCSQTGIRIDLELPENLPRLGSSPETAAFRFVQEALTNIARYAGVDVAKVVVGKTDNSLTISVLDRGIGFDVQAVLSAAKTAGIGGMRERIALVGGSVTVKSNTGVGTSVTATIPLIGPTI